MRPINIASELFILFYELPVEYTRNTNTIPRTTGQFQTYDTPSGLQFPQLLLCQRIPPNPFPQILTKTDKPSLIKTTANPRKNSTVAIFCNDKLTRKIRRQRPDNQFKDIKETKQEFSDSAKPRPLQE